MSKPAPAQRDKRMPYLKWYSRDWRSNAKLRLCSLAGRGLWADMLSLMAEADPRGFLLVDGVPPSSRQLASLIGADHREVKKLLDELCTKRVCSVVGGAMPDDVSMLIPGDIPEGVILSRRIVRDEAKALKNRINGILGGNPSLNRSVNPAVNPRPNPHSHSQIYESESESLTDAARDPAPVHSSGPRASRPETSKERLARLAFEYRQQSLRKGEP